MKLAFCIPKFFPFGGLQLDFLRIARACLQRGHDIVVYTLVWDGDIPKDLTVHVVPLRSIRNHARNGEFIEKTRSLLARGEFDGVIGFMKMPGLDIYFAADPCYQSKARARSRWYRASARYRRFVEFESAVFRPDSRTEILMIVEPEIDRYRDCYQTSRERFHLLPPGIQRNRMAPADAPAIRAALRQEFGVTAQEHLLIMVGSDFKRKGLDRTLRAVASLPAGLREQTRLMVLGESNSRPFGRLAKRLGLSRKVLFLGGRDDVPRFLLGADLLVHPAYTETAGIVLLEAIVAGLPVLTTANCGYAFHVDRARAGVNLPVPFSQDELNRRLAHMLSAPEERERWSRNGIRYGLTEDLYSLPEAAAETISALLSRRRP